MIKKQLIASTPEGEKIIASLTDAQVNEVYAIANDAEQTALDAAITAGQTTDECLAAADKARVEAIDKYLASVPTDPEKNTEAKAMTAQTPALPFKFTFEFEVYQESVLKRATEVSALGATEAAALETAVAAIKAELGEDETFRYTNKFRKESAEEVTL